jgi:hypothetical protein
LRSDRAEQLGQRILTKVVKSGYVEEIERKYKLRS